MSEVTILGAGAVGALLGVALAEAGVATTLVTREASAAALRRDGLLVESPRLGDGRRRPHVATAVAGAPAVLLVATKAPGLHDALARVEGEPGIVVPLLNGVDHLAPLRERFGAGRVVAGSVRVQAHRAGATHVVHRSPMLLVTVAEPGAPALEDALRAAGVDVGPRAPEPTVLWGKLSRLAALALATTAADAPLGTVRAEAEAVAHEVAAVARAEGADVEAATVVGELRDLPDDASSSLRADVVAGVAEHELDAIGGAVLRAAARHDLPAPATAELVRRARARAELG